MVYQYRVKGLHKTPAQVAGEICEKLEQSEDGLTPRTLLDASRDVNAPLQDEFEWNDSEAAERYREQQAGAIIRNLYVITAEHSTTENTRAFVNVHHEPKQGNFHNIRVVMDNEAMREKLFASAKRDMQSFIAKYKTLEVLSGVIAEMRLIS